MRLEDDARGRSSSDDGRVGDLSEMKWMADLLQRRTADLLQKRELETFFVSVEPAFLSLFSQLFTFLLPSVLPPSLSFSVLSELFSALSFLPFLLPSVPYSSKSQKILFCQNSGFKYSSFGLLLKVLTIRCKREYQPDFLEPSCHD